MPEASTQTDALITLTIDGREVSVPKGTNIIEAARKLAIEIPFYCYHPHLSVPGNCRMCQVEVVGAPKLMIGCHTQVQQGMQVKTNHSSEVVKAAQNATLEFILINHPLDCTVCDQAGHCKLQDYHYDYNARGSRFLEQKEHKVKAVPLGPEVILDGERCIMCTRCIRFCDEVTGTSELGMLNRGDRSVIAVNPGKELNNPLAGTVVDLCPVGALTHRRWRFNTRIWYTERTATICPGCSTGCNCEVATRDGQVVTVKARLNSEVNKEWMCDQGRYGFDRFLPSNRILNPRVNAEEVSWDLALKEASKAKGEGVLVFVAPDLLLEEYSLLKAFLEKYSKGFKVALGFRQRALTPVESVLISPDFAANYMGVLLSGLLDFKSPEELERQYLDALTSLRQNAPKVVIVIGDNALLPGDCDLSTVAALKKAEVSLGLICDADTALASALKVVLPGRSILEKAGLLVNGTKRIQYSDKVLEAPAGTEPSWRVFNRIAEKYSTTLTAAQSDRDLTLELLKSTELLKGLTIKQIKAGGVSLSNRVA